MIKSLQEIKFVIVNNNSTPAANMILRTRDIQPGAEVVELGFNDEHFLMLLVAVARFY